MRALATPLIVILSAGCSGQAPSSAPMVLAEASPLVQPPGDARHIADLQKLVARLIEGREPVAGVRTTDQRAALQRLYGSDRQPKWLDGSGTPTADARDALAALTGAADDGLDPADYQAAVVSKLARCIDAAPPIDLARFDVGLTAGMLNYLHDLHTGRVSPADMGFRVHAPQDRHDFAELLRKAIDDGRIAALVADFRPKLGEYARLRDVLQRYRALASDRTYAAVPPFATPVHPGDPYDAAAVLERQLAALGDIRLDRRATRAPDRYGGVVVDAVKRFQMRHGLAADGTLGKSTIAALRVPLTVRVRQIELALERLRWLPHPNEQRLVALNIPMFRLWAWDAPSATDAPAFATDAIVGRALKTQTPIFVEQMSEVIFRPYWNVPPSIALHEVLPKIDRDPDYLRRENMEIVGRDGDGAAIGPTVKALAGVRAGTLRIRQRPGPSNALGPIKFVFPNQDDVYMHGTPAQALFARSRRDFSHGCVRVADPVALATWVLQDRAEWTRDRIIEAATGSRTITVKLARPIRVILFYTTAAIMPDDGTLRFADDIYRQDERLERLLAGHQIGR